MESRHLYTIRWAQPYATYKQRPYLRSLQEQLEKKVEQWLIDEPDYPDAKAILERVMKL
jgi:hypothetical protein